MGHNLFDRRLREAEAVDRLRTLKIFDSVDARMAVMKGRAIVHFASNDYLGLKNHPAVIDASIEATKRYGAGSGGSRLLTGTIGLTNLLEEKIAGFLRRESALYFANGYAANLGLITALAGKGDTIIADRLVHASIIDGARLSGAKLKRFAHNDPDALEQKLASLRKEDRDGGLFVITEGVFSMDGDMGKLTEIGKAAKRHGAIFIVDDAHGFGLFGEDGKGTVFIEPGTEGLVDIVVVTAGKSLGSGGGFVCARRKIIDMLVNFARPFIYSTAPPPGQVGATMAALDITASGEGAALRDKLRKNIGLLEKKLSDVCYTHTSTSTQITPVFVPEGIIEKSGSMLEEGLFVPAIRPPTVPPGTERFRISLSSAHTEEDIDLLVSALGFNA